MNFVTGTNRLIFFAHEKKFDLFWEIVLKMCKALTTSAL